MSKLEQSLKEAGYELTEHYSLPKGQLAIRPIKPEKEKYLLELRNMADGGKHLLDEDFMLTPTQAKAISEAIEALLEYVTTKTEYSQGDTGKLTDAAFAAKQALRGEQ